jgi:DNA-binding MarR family transcriptional regulator
MVLAASPDARLPIFEVNAALVSTPPNTSWLTTRMEERGLITKTRFPEDRRVVMLELTESGWEALADAAPLAFDAERELLADLSRSDIKMLAELLGRFLG